MLPDRVKACACSPVPRSSPHSCWFRVPERAFVRCGVHLYSATSTARGLSRVRLQSSLLQGYVFAISHHVHWHWHWLASQTQEIEPGSALCRLQASQQSSRRQMCWDSGALLARTGSRLHESLLGSLAENCARRKEGKRDRVRAGRSVTESRVCCKGSAAKPNTDVLA